MSESDCIPAEGDQYRLRAEIEEDNMESSAEFDIAVMVGAGFHPNAGDVAVAREILASNVIRRIRAEAWDARSNARGQYLGPDAGHYEDCYGYEDCRCASYPNPYRAEEDD